MQTCFWQVAEIISSNVPVAHCSLSEESSFVGSVKSVGITVPTAAHCFPKRCPSAFRPPPTAGTGASHVPAGLFVIPSPLGRKKVVRRQKIRFCARCCRPGSFIPQLRSLPPSSKLFSKKRRQKVCREGKRLYLCSRKRGQTE